MNPSDLSPGGIVSPAASLPRAEVIDLRARAGGAHARSGGIGAAVSSVDAAPARPAANEDGPVGGRAAGLRVALFSGNYNCVEDGANKALNRLVGHLLQQGAAVRVYSPTIDKPAFTPVGDLVSVPSVSIPRRPEYRLARGLPARVRADVEAFRPNIVHLSAPDILGVKARRLGRELGVPVVASLHTRFETYFRFYGIGFIEPWVVRHLRGFYDGCDLVLAPNAPIAEELAADGLGDRVRLWSRGVDRNLFSPAMRDEAWRAALGYAPDDVVVLFLGRLVLEKGLDVFARMTEILRAQGHRVRPLVVGDGPAGGEFVDRLGPVNRTGFLRGPDLGRAIASADILVNPSVTEAFGNVNLEAMAAGLAVVSADVPSARALIEPGRSGLLVPPHDARAYADAVAALIADPALRAQLSDGAQAVADEYQWSRTLDAVVDAYREVRSAAGA